MTRNWLNVTEKTIAAAGLVALLGNCNKPADQDGGAGGTQQSSVSAEKDANKKNQPHEVAIEIFGNKYDHTTSGKTRLCDDLQAKLKEAVAIYNQLQGHLRNQDLDAFTKDYQKSQEIMGALLSVYSEPFTKYFEADKGPGQQFLEIHFSLLKTGIEKHVEVRAPFGILFANLTENITNPKAYSGLEHCCADPKASSFAAKLKSFGTNYTQEQRGGTSPVGSWKLTVVFDDKKLKAMKGGEKEHLPDGEFVTLQYSEPLDSFSFFYTKRTKPNDRGNTKLTEREFRIVDLGEHGVLSGTDARLNGVHPDQIAGVNGEYKSLLKRTLNVVEIRYGGKYIKYR